MQCFKFNNINNHDWTDELHVFISVTFESRDVSNKTLQQLISYSGETAAANTICQDLKNNEVICIEGMQTIYSHYLDLGTIA